MAGTSNFSLLVAIKANADQFRAGLDKAKADLNSFSSHVGTKMMDTFKGIGAAIGIAFSVGAIINFTKESMKLAAAGEGIHNAFAKLGHVDLGPLREATRGVITDTELEKLTVKARSFNVPIKDLSVYLQYATQRAMATGGSVAELTEQIVNGLGRKSARALVSLGFTQKEVNDATKTYGGLLELVQKKLDGMGLVVDTTAIKWGRVQTSVTNLKEAWGDFVNKSDIVNKALAGTTNRFQILGDTGLTAWQKIWFGHKQYAKWKAEQEPKEEAARKALEVYSDKDLINLQKYYKDPVYAKIIKERLDAAKANATVTDVAAKSEEQIFKEAYKVTQELEKQHALWKKQIDDAELLAEKLNAPSKGLKAIAVGGYDLKTPGSQIKLPGAFAKPIVAPGLADEKKAIKANEILAKHNKEIGDAIERQTDLNEKADAYADILEKMNKQLEKGADSWKEYGKQVRDAVKQAIGAMIAQGVTSMIMNALKDAKGPLLFFAPVLAAIAAGLARTAFNTLIPSYASGTNFAPGGLSLVGERGPELVNLPMGSQVYSNTQSQNMGGELTCRVEADALVFVLNNHSRKLGSFR